MLSIDRKRKMMLRKGRMAKGEVSRRLDEARGFEAPLEILKDGRLALRRLEESSLSNATPLQEREWKEDGKRRER
jgi:hypothetical protein